MTSAKRNKTSQSPSRIPTFDNIEQEAAFWDEHSIEEFADELEEVKDVRFVVKRGRSIPVLLSLEDIAILEAEAHRRGTTAEDVASQWIAERLEALATSRKPD